MPPPQGAPWRNYRRKHEVTEARVRQQAQPAGKRKRGQLAAMTGIQGGHNHVSLTNSTNDQTKLIANITQRSYMWLKAGLLTATPRLKKYMDMHKDVCKVYARRYNKKKTKAVASNTQPPPTTVEKALNMEEKSARKWWDSILDEWNGLGALGVLDHGHTIGECKAMGINTTPVPLSLILDHKFDETGELKALKTRLAVR